MTPPSGLRAPLWIVLGLGVAGACAPTAEPRSPRDRNNQPEPPVELVGPVASLPQGPSERCLGKSIPLALNVPQLAAWQRSDRKNALSLHHPRSSTTMTVRFWSASRLVTPEQCTEQWLLLDPDAKSQLDATRAIEPVIKLPFSPGENHVGRLWSKVRRSREGQLLGWVHGVSAGLGHCISFDATTTIPAPASASPPSAAASGETLLGERLNLLVHDVAETLTLQAIDARGQPLERRARPAADKSPSSH